MMISIVLSTYNGAAYIKEQLDSLREQSRQPDEVLIIDDNSSDDTVKIVTNYIDKNKLTKWKIHSNIDNVGWRVNFFQGIKKSSGDLIFPCDQDDIWEHDKLEKMESIMSKNQDIQLLVSNYCAFYQNGNEIVGPSKENGCVEKIPYTKKIFDTPYPGCTYCIRRSLIKKSEKYWEKDYPHDAFFWRLALITEGAFSYNVTLIKWRKHEHSAYYQESKESKKLIKKIEWLSYAENVINGLMVYNKENRSANMLEKDKILSNALEWCELRKKFLKTKKIRYGLRLIIYLHYYSRVRQYLGDWYLVFGDNERCDL